MRVGVFERVKFKKSVKSLEEVISKEVQPQWDLKKFIDNLTNCKLSLESMEKTSESTSGSLIFNYSVYEKMNDIIVVFDVPGLTTDDFEIAFPTGKIWICFL